MTQRSPRNPLDRLIIPSQSSIPTSPAPVSTLDLIPTARQVKQNAQAVESIAKRRASRAAFDKKYPCFGYFIPAQLHLEAKQVRATIRGIAQDPDNKINTTEISMTTALVMWALAQVRSGKLVIMGSPDSRRRKMSVIVEDVSDDWEKKPVEIKPAEKKFPTKRLTFTYRFPHDVEVQINKIATTALPKGEVLIRLLQHAIRAYENGGIKINSTSMEIRQAANVVEMKKVGDSWT